MQLRYHGHSNDFPHTRFFTGSDGWVYMNVGHCRETSSRRLRDFTDRDMTVDNKDTLFTLSEIAGTSDRDLNHQQQRALDMLSRSLSAILFYQGYEFEDDNERERVLYRLMREWSGFNSSETWSVPKGPVLKPEEYHIEITMDKCYSNQSGTIYNLPFKMLRYRPIMSMITAVPRAFTSISRNKWCFVGHRIPTYRAYGPGYKLWQQMYAAVGDALGLYEYCGTYWWGLLSLLIENVGSDELLGLMDRLHHSNGVRSFFKCLSNKQVGNTTKALMNHAKNYGSSAFGTLRSSY